MKYVLTFTARLNGSERENEEAAKRGVELFAKWQQPESSTFHQFLGRVDGMGGFAVIETDDPADLLEGASAFAPLNEFALFPVVDVDQWMAAGQQAVAFRESVG
jgi:hypothetical protein